MIDPWIVVVLLLFAAAMSGLGVVKYLKEKAPLGVVVDGIAMVAYLCMISFYLQSIAG